MAKRDKRVVNWARAERVRKAKIEADHRWLASMDGFNRARVSIGHDVWRMFGAK